MHLYVLTLHSRMIYLSTFLSIKIQKVESTSEASLMLQRGVDCDALWGGQLFMSPVVNCDNQDKA